MAVIKFSQNGLSISGGGNPHPVGNKRGNVTGWSRDSARRNTRFLQSIIPDDLSGNGFALTLTLRDIPPTQTDWHRLTTRLFDQIRKTPGFLRCHWLMELQRRGAPHLHMAVYFDPYADNAQRFAGPRLVAEWVRIAGEYRPSMHSQVCKPIDGPTGWLKYLAKHGARSVAHYQRQGMPPGWEKTGRLWGSFGAWPVEAWHEVEVSVGQWNRHRRLAQRYLLAQARSDALRYEARGEWLKAAGSWDRVAYLRRMRKCPDRSLSMCRGVSGWVPLDVSVALLAAVGWRERVAVAPVVAEPLPAVDPVEFARQWAAGQFGPIGSPAAIRSLISCATKSTHDASPSLGDASVHHARCDFPFFV